MHARLYAAAACVRGGLPEEDCTFARRVGRVWPAEFSKRERVRVEASRRGDDEDKRGRSARFSTRSRDISGDSSEIRVGFFLEDKRKALATLISLPSLFFRKRFSGIALKNLANTLVFFYAYDKR